MMSLRQSITRGFFLALVPLEIGPEGNGLAAGNPAFALGFALAFALGIAQLNIVACAIFERCGKMTFNCSAEGIDEGIIFG